jgi:protein TonB
VNDPLEFLRRLWHRTLVVLGAMGLTLAFFLVLPLFQSITQAPVTDLVVQGLETTQLPPPPPPLEEEPEEEPEPEEKPPELSEQTAPLDLAQIELALNPTLGEGWFGADTAVSLESMMRSGGAGDAVEELISMSDLDQKPRALYQPNPVLDAAARKRTPGSVTIVFVVDPRGKVVDPVVQKSSDPALDGPALAAVRQWRFEPGKKNGQPVRFRMRVPITFSKG